MAHFKNPLMVRDNEYFKHYDENYHDGMIIDNMTFNKWKLADGAAPA